MIHYHPINTRFSLLVQYFNTITAEHPPDQLKFSGNKQKQEIRNQTNVMNTIRAISHTSSN
jgi:hypothetical protein